MERLATWWAFALFVGGVASLVAAAGLAAASLAQEEYLTLGARQLERYATWSVVRDPPEKVRGDKMRTLVVSISRERRANARKAKATRSALTLVMATLLFLGAEVVVLAREYVQ